MHFVKSFDSEKIVYQIFHQPKKATKHLLIVPGFGGDLNFFHPTVAKLIALQPNLEIIAISPRGHGFSSHKFPSGYESTLTIHAQDLLALVKHLNLKDFILLGHSFGGIIVQNYLNLPDAPQPEKVFLVCTTPKMIGYSPLSSLAYWLLSTFSQSENHFQNQAPDFYQSFNKTWDIDLRRWRHDIRVMGGISDWFLNFFAMSGWKNTAFNQLNRETAYYLYGKTDIIIPSATQKKYLNELKKLTRIELPGGHLPPLTNPDELAETIAKNL